MSKPKPADNLSSFQISNFH